MIALPGGRWLLLELKSEKGRLRSEQRALGRQFMYLGHEIYVVKSFKRFLEIAGEINGKKS